MGDCLLQQQQQQIMVALDLEPGFRFHPTDEELIICYLTPKVLDRGFCATAIEEVDLNKFEPWELPGKAKMGEKEWYFFGHKDRKYPTGMRTNRATKAGHWKATGKDKEINHPSPNTAPVLIGMKKTLVFYKGRAPKGEKTNWVMHEYRLEGTMPYPPTNNTYKDEWVVCRIFHKSSGIMKDMAPSYAMSGAIMNDERINNPMAMGMDMPTPMPMPMPMPNMLMPTMGEQGFTLNSITSTLSPLIDTSSLYGATAGITSSVVPPPSSSYEQLLHVGPSIGNATLPMNVENYFWDNQMAEPMQAPAMFEYHHQQMHIGEEGFIVDDPTSRPSLLVSWEDMAVLNNNGQNNATAAVATIADIFSSVDMGMDGMWKYREDPSAEKTKTHHQFID